MRTQTLSHIIAADLGELVDFTAVTVIESERGTRTPIHQIRHLDRWQGASCSERLIPELIRLIAALTTLAGKPVIVIDRTGVGVPMVNQIREAKLGARVIAISIHGGETTKGAGDFFSVPKKDLVGSVSVPLQTGRLKIAPDLPYVDVLKTELGNFRSKINPATAHESFSAWREAEHDDMVLSAAVGLWWAERPRKVARVW